MHPPDPVQHEGAECVPCAQAQKVYVQDRLRESGRLVWDLLEARGHFYICGDAAQMAGAVERELLHIIESHQVSTLVSQRSPAHTTGAVEQELLNVIARQTP